MSRIDRIRHAVPLRRAARTDSHRTESSGSANLPVPVGPAIAVTPPLSAELPHGESEFNAHVMGQDGQRRGLRAGPPLLDAARHAYNQVEWSGSWDRRARAGRRARTDI